MRIIPVLLFLIGSEIAFGQFSGPKNSTNVYDGGGGQFSETWSNPNLARSQNDLYASLVTTTKNKRSNYLQAQKFGFKIPAGSSINGIVVEIDRFATATSGGSAKDARVRIIDATGTIGSDDKAITSTDWPSSDLDAYASYGGSTDTWGITDWTPAKINNNNFGVAIQAETSNTNFATFNLFVDEIRITVYYTTSAGQRYAVASGNWNSASTWATTPGGTPGASVPTAANDVFIGGGFTVTQDVAGASCNSLTIGTDEANPVGKLTFNNNNRDIDIGGGGIVITADGDVLSSYTPTLTTSGDLTIDAVVTNVDFTLKIDGTNRQIISGSGTIGILNVQTYSTHTDHLAISQKVSGPSGRLINGTSGYLIFSGKSSNMDTDVLDLSQVGNTIEFSQVTSVTANFDVHKGSSFFYNLVISGNSPKFYNGDITINGDLTITSTGILSNTNQHAITIYGNWLNNNGAPGFVPNSCNACAVVFSGGNEQTIANSSGEQFYRVEVNKIMGTTVTAQNNIVIDNKLLMTQGNFDCGANSLTGTAATVFDNGELIIGTTGSTVPALTGTYTLNSGTITFNGAGAQTIRSTTSSPAISSYVNVQFLGSGIKSLSGAIAVSNDLVIGGTATLDATTSNHAINLKGNWTNSSTFNPRSGTVTLSGTSSQTITNVAGESFYNLVINNTAASSSIILGGPATVNNVVTFTDGMVISTSTNILSLASSASTSSTSDASHVNGPVAKTTSSTSAFAFPIGDGTNYMPASVTPTSASTTTYVAEYFAAEQTLGAPLGAGIDHVSTQDYWFVNRTNGTSDAAVTLVWEYPSSTESEINAMSELRVAQWNGTQWTNQGNTATTGNTTAGSVKSNGISSFTQPYFILASSTTNNPLSINRYFVAATGNWNTANVWAYRSGGTANAPEPTSTKNVIIVAGNVATILDSSVGEATKSMLSLTVNGTLTLSNSNARDITVNVGTGGFTLNSAANITGSDNGDVIHMSGNVTLKNSSSISHTTLTVDFASQGNTITGTVGKLPILLVNQNNQVFTGTTSYTNLTINSTATNNGTISITGVLSGNSSLTNSSSGLVDWKGTSVSGKVVDATTVGNSVRLVNNTGGNIDINQVVSASTYYNLILAGANNFTQGADVDINGNLTIQSGAVFNNSSNNKKLYVRGNWVNNNGAAGFLNGTNTITFDGSSAQTIYTSSGNEVFAKMEINNTSSTGVTITQGEVHITNDLILTDGVLYTDATHLLVIEDNATADAGSADSFVDGPMKKIGNEAFVFPVGNGTTWARLGMESISGFNTTTEFTCQYIHSAYSNTTSLNTDVHNVSTLEHWLLTRVTDPSNDASCLVRLYWESQSGSSIEDLPDLRVGHYYNGPGGLKWYNFGGTGSDAGGGTGSIVSTSTFTSFSPITFASEFGFNALPVELTSFTAAVGDDGVVNLRWVTASELNNDHFTVERSRFGKNFEDLVEIPGSGYTNSATVYTAEDRNPFGGMTYYRLRQTDFDGTTSFSKIIYVKTPDEPWSVYPNPSDGSIINIQLSGRGESQQVNLRVCDVRGVTLVDQTLTSDQDGVVRSELKSRLSPGIYIVLISDGLDMMARQLVVK